MTTALSVFFIFIGVGIAVWLVSFIMEALRPVPQAPRTLRWARDIPVQSVEVGCNTLRYIKTGKGPNLVLVHTLRTQLDASSIPPELMQEMYLVGNRPGHDRAFLSLLRNAESWETATKDYGRIEVPVLLIWGDRDWAKPSEREHDRMLIPNAQMTTLEHGGHFLPLDRPSELSEAIISFAGR